MMISEEPNARGGLLFLELGRDGSRGIAGTARSVGVEIAFLSLSRGSMLDLTFELTRTWDSDGSFTRSLRYSSRRIGACVAVINDIPSGCP